MTDGPRVLIIGEGIAGLATALALAVRGIPVTQLSRHAALASESAARHDGIDAALGEDDSPKRHADDLRRLGADGEAIEAMCERAPGIVRDLGQLGIPFERSRGDSLRLEKLPGSSVARTVHAGDLTGRHVARRLSQRLLGFEARGVLERHVGWQLLGLAKEDGGRIAGCVARHAATGDIASFPARAVCLATGGHLGLFWAEGHAAPSLGAATSIAFRHGARVANVRRARTTPLGWSTGGFVRALPERLLAENARLESGLLDLSELDRAKLRRAAGAALASHAIGTHLDAYSEAVPVRSTVTRTLGGAWVGPDHRTTVDGLYVVGGACAAYFGDDTTSGTALLAALFGAERAAEAMAEESHEPRSEKLEQAEEEQRELVEGLLGENEDEAPSPFELQRQLADIVQNGGDLDAFADQLHDTRAGDAEPRANTGLEALLDLRAVLPLARAATAERDHEGPARWRWDDEHVEAVS